MQFLFVSSAVLLLLVLLAADHVVNRFAHSKASKRVLAVEGAAALLLGLWLSWKVFAGLEPYWRVPLGLLFAGPLFILSAFVTVEIWRKLKQQEFDREIARIRREIDRATDQLEHLRWDLERARRRELLLESENREEVSERRRLEEEIGGWQEDEGMARLRSIKVQGWRREAEGLDDVGLESHIRDLEEHLRQGSEAGEQADRLRQMRVRLNVVQLVRMERGGSHPDTEIRELKKQGEDHLGERDRLERCLAGFRDELRMWERRRSAFLRDRITLD